MVLLLLLLLGRPDKCVLLCFVLPISCTIAATIMEPPRRSGAGLLHLVWVLPPQGRWRLGVSGRQPRTAPARQTEQERNRHTHTHWHPWHFWGENVFLQTCPCVSTAPYTNMCMLHDATHQATTAAAAAAPLPTWVWSCLQQTTCRLPWMLCGPWPRHQPHPHQPHCCMHLPSACPTWACGCQQGQQRAGQGSLGSALGWSRQEHTAASAQGYYLPTPIDTGQPSVDAQRCRVSMWTHGQKYHRRDSCPPCFASRPKSLVACNVVKLPTSAVEAVSWVLIAV